MATIEKDIIEIQIKEKGSSLFLQQAPQQRRQQSLNDDPLEEEKENSVHMNQHQDQQSDLRLQQLNDSLQESTIESVQKEKEEMREKDPLDPQSLLNSEVPKELIRNDVEVQEQINEALSDLIQGNELKFQFADKFTQTDLVEPEASKEPSQAKIELSQRVKPLRRLLSINSDIPQMEFKITNYNPRVRQKSPQNQQQVLKFLSQIQVIRDKSLVNSPSKTIYFFKARNKTNTKAFYKRTSSQVKAPQNESRVPNHQLYKELQITQKKREFRKRERIRKIYESDVNMKQNKQMKIKPSNRK